MAIDSSYIFTNEWCHGDTPSTNAPLPPATQAYTGDGRTSIAKGFPQETSEPLADDGVPPARVDMNGILRQITANLVWYGKGGLFDWVSTYVYSRPAIVRYATDGNYYKCIATTVPAGTLPTNTSYWKRILDVDDIGDLQNLYLPLTGGTLTGALTGTTGAFSYVTCQGTAATSNIGFIGKSSTSGTADKVQNSISLKNVSGSTVAFNGSQGIDLTGGVYYATSAGKVTNTLTLKDTSGTTKTFNGSANLDLSGGVYYANRATNDANGTNIANTYLKKTGDTMTGALFTPSGLTVLKQNSTNEGGELWLEAPSSSYCNSIIDNYTNCTRIRSSSSGASSSFELNHVTGSITWGGNEIRFVKEAYRSGSEWYRKWSDGWIEQGGYVSGNQTVTLHVAFSNADYTVNATRVQGGGSYGYRVPGFVTGRTTTSFSNTGEYSLPTTWYACGY